MPGAADLPLHGGRVPPWMLKLMEGMAEKIVEAVIEIHGVEGLLRGLSDPVWFQAFNNVIGMDWDSSGSTTVVTGILKSISWRKDLGFLVLGGKGGRMRMVPDEAREAEKRLGIDGSIVVKASRLAARAASTLLQDGYTLYHHSVIASPKGILVVEQGMNPEEGMARRYHIDRVIVEEPFSGVSGTPQREVLNTVSSRSREARRLFLDLISEGSVSRILRLLGEANRIASGMPAITDYLSQEPVRVRPTRGSFYRPVRPSRQLVRSIEALINYSPSSELELALAPGLGPAIVRALALISDLVYSVPVDDRDPVTHPLDPFLYAYAVGGKDGVPYRFNPETARRVIEVLEDVVNSARLGERERLRALARLRSLVRGTPRGRS